MKKAMSIFDSISTILKTNDYKPIIATTRIRRSVCGIILSDVTILLNGNPVTEYMRWNRVVISMESENDDYSDHHWTTQKEQRIREEEVKAS